MKKYLKLIFLFSFLLLLTACGKTTYEIDNEVRVEFEGYDEHGKAIVQINKDRLFTQLNEMLKLKDRMEVVEFESLLADLDVQATPNENLKNGDEIKLELIYAKDNSIDLELKLKNPKVKVEKLEPIHALTKEEIFAGVDINYKGVSPFLEATITTNSSGKVSNLFNYSLPEQYFKNDEEIQVTAEPRGELLSSGYKVNEKDFINTIKVPIKERYVESWEELNEDDQKYILAEIQDVVTAKIDSQIQVAMTAIYDQGKHIATGKFITKSGQSKIDEPYFLFVKEREFDNAKDRFNEDANSIRMIFKNSITIGDYIFNEDYSNKTKDYFSVVGASNIIVDENGKLLRELIKVKTYGKPDLNKDIVKNETVNNIKDMFTIDHFEIKN